jgi:hypothetical protein
MERLFSPCTRYREILGSRGRLAGRGNHYPELLRELNLDVSIEELLSTETGFTYADLYAMLGNGNTVAWLTPHVAVVRESDRAFLCCCFLQPREDYRFSFIVDGTEIFAVPRSSAALLEIVDVVLRLLAASVVHSVCLQKRCSPVVPINAASLAYLMEHCQSLKVLALRRLEIDENHCRVLGACSRSGLEIELRYCRLTSAETSALVEVLRQNRGPAKIDSCRVDSCVLADGLRGNSHLKSLSLCISSDDLEDGNREVIETADALRENKGLVDLNLSHDFRMSDETWDAVCNSLKTHPTLQVLDLSSAFIDSTIAPAVLRLRIQSLLDMMEVNTSICTIHLDSHYTEHELFRRSVVPYLVTNRLRPRLLAIQKTRPSAYRAKLRGRALLAVRTDANSGCFYRGIPKSSFHQRLRRPRWS